MFIPGVCPRTQAIGAEREPRSRLGAAVGRANRDVPDEFGMITQIIFFSSTKHPIPRNVKTILPAQVALFFGMCIRLFQSRLDVLASRNYWVFCGKLLRTARRDCLIRHHLLSEGTKTESAREKRRAKRDGRSGNPQQKPTSNLTS